MRRPRTTDLPAHLADTARAVAARLAGEGHRGWMVGGAVRDLALELPVSDLDLASAATPEEVERIFPRTRAVGRAFGTVIVLEGEVPCQVTTYRSEAGYRDARRPDHVEFGSTLEEDARRRDFTANALYLDPLTDELADPVGGWADLQERLLRCVGDPAARFAEDGLRILRLARFEATRDLVVEPATREAAAANLGSLRGVSPERVFQELRAAVKSGRGARVVRTWGEVGADGVVLGASVPTANLDALERSTLPADLAVFLSLLLLPRDEQGRPLVDAAALAGSAERLAALRPPREVEVSVAEVWKGLVLLRSPLRPGSRARRIRLVREESWPRRLAAARALGARAFGGDELDALEELAKGLGEAERFPEPLVTSADLDRLGLPRGPAWSELLRAAEDERLEGRHTTRAQALAWLEQRVASEAGE